MTEVQDHRSALLAQAEDLYFEAERRKLRVLYDREHAAAASRAARRSRLAFLKACNATPWDVNEYEAWLEGYVRAGHAVEAYRSGAYPRALQEQAAESPIFDAARRSSGIEVGSLEEEYYASAVIWHVAEPVTYDELPKFAARDVSLSLHLSREAMSSFDDAKLLWMVPNASVRLYMDGRWQGGRWIDEPSTWNAVAAIWAENLENLRSRAAKEA